MPRPLTADVKLGRIQLLPGSGSGPVLFLSFSIFTQGAPATTTLHRLSVTRAVDNEDRPFKVEPPLVNFENRINRRAPTANPLLETIAVFAAPPPGTRSIKLIEGTIELHVPPNPPPAPVVIADLAEKLGTTLTHPLLAQHRVEVRLLDAAGWDAIKAETAFPKENKVDGAVYLWIKDPALVLSAWEFQAAGGATLSRSSSTQREGGQALVRYVAGGPLGAGTQLALSLALPESIRALPFKLENVSLP